MDWFKEAEYAATDLLKGRIEGTITEAEAAKHPIISNGYVSQKEDGYLHITPMNFSEGDHSNGWKFHLSVDPTQIKAAFNQIAPELMKEGVTFKIREANHHASVGDLDNDQRGKGIVIYPQDGKDMTDIMKRIEQKLVDAGIRPGPSVNNEKKLGGSSYAFYRNDQDESARYIKAADLDRLPEPQRFNPLNKPDPYQNMDVSPARPAIKTRSPLLSVATPLTNPLQHPTSDARIHSNPGIKPPKLTEPKDPSRQLIATTEITVTSKGNYLGVGLRPTDVEAIHTALKQQGFQESIDYTVKPSSLNNGGNVIALTDQGSSRVGMIKETNKSESLRTPEAVRSTEENHRKIIAESAPTYTDKGIYIGVGANKTELKTLQNALKQQGFQESIDYTVKPSSLNQGNDIIAFSKSGEDRFMGIRAAHHEQTTKPSAKPEQASPIALSSKQGNSGGVSSSTTPIRVSANATPTTEATPPTHSPPTASLQNQPLPHNPTPTMGSLALAPEPEIPLKLNPAPQQPVIDQTVSPPPANASKMKPDESPTHTKISAGGVGQKMDAHAGKASLSIQVASEAARGNYVAATATAAVAIAEQQGIKFIAKRIPVLGGVITAGMTLWGAGTEAAKGNWKKAGSELVAGAAETVGNVVGFGAGDALREGTRKAMLVAGVKTENAPDKSGLRVAVETAYDLGKVVTDTAKLKSMSKADLAKSIQTDPTLPHKLNLRGQEVTLVQAMEDKTFRTTFIKGKEEEAKKNPAAQKTVAALKEYAARLEASPQTQQAALKPTTAASPATPAISAQQVAQYKSMSVNQLGAAIQKDDVLPDRVKISGKEVDLAEALKDKNFRQSMISNMEAAQAKGTDMATQIAMIKTYGEKLDTTTPAAAPLMAANKQKPAIAAPVA
ncbi:MAG: hypothetical protein JNL76_01695 [Alphaproteobacteria bacterium]|nr:hypothetical protein [Alphaproteobacteria bacterium]